MDVLYLYLNDILEDNPPYVQSGCCCIQSNSCKLHLRNIFVCATCVQHHNLIDAYFYFSLSFGKK